MICNKPQILSLSNYQEISQSSKCSLKRITYQCCLFLQQIQLLESRRQTCVTATGCCSQEQRGHLEDEGVLFQSLGSIHRNCSRPETSQKKLLFLVASISVIDGPSLCSHYIPVPPSGLPPLEMKKRENTQPGAGQMNEWAP